MQVENNNTGLINLTTWAKQKDVFYKVTSSAIRVQVKGHANAVISLVTEPGTVIQYSIIIKPEYRNTISIKLQNATSVFDVPDSILSPSKYNNFDISWSEGKLSVQAEGFSFKHDKECPEFLYMTFGTKIGSDPVHWRFQLTPHQVRKQLQQITLKGMPNHKWVQVTVNPKIIRGPELPEDALIGGYEQDRLYVVRAKHRGSLTPGKFSVFENIAYIPWGGASNQKLEFEVLCSINCKWVKTRDNLIPVDALEGGYSEDNKERLYIGRAHYMDHLIVGKVQPSHKCCYIPYEEREASVKEFEVLVECKNPNERYAAHEFVIPEVWDPVMVAPDWPAYVHEEDMESDEEDPIVY